MQFNVAQFLKQATEAPRFHLIENAVVPGLDQDLVLLTPLNGQIKLIKTGNDVLVTGTLTATLELPCSRCLAPTRAQVTVKIEETFTPTRDVTTGIQLPQADDVDTATLIDERHILDLTEVVRQELLLSQPGQILCHSNCLGLCPYCGQNKNQAACACNETVIDARWSGLLSLKDEPNNP